VAGGSAAPKPGTGHRQVESDHPAGKPPRRSVRRPGWLRHTAWPA